MIQIPIDERHRIARGIHGIWVLEKKSLTKTSSEIWAFVSNCREMKNLVARMLDHKVSLSPEVLDTLEGVQRAYDEAAEAVAVVLMREGIGGKLETELARLEGENESLRAEVKDLKSRFSEKKGGKGKTPHAEIT